MTRSASLLERIRDPDEDARRSLGDDTEKLAASVTRHLERMLNTRQGHATAQPEFGMPDITGCAESLPETLDRVRLAIKYSIETFEPRLRKVKIRQLPSEDSFALHFGISCQLVTGRGDVPVYLSTRVSPSGSTEVVGGADDEWAAGASASRDRDRSGSYVKPT